MTPEQRLGRGFTLLELVFAMAVFALGLSAILSVYATSEIVKEVARQEALASQVARQVAERLQEQQHNEGFPNILTTYKALPNFNVSAAGSVDDQVSSDLFAGGPSSVVLTESVTSLRALVPVGGNAYVGVVRFPLDADGKLLEELVTAEWGGGRTYPSGKTGLDLNMNGDIDTGVDMSVDKKVLPVKIELNWIGPVGPLKHELFLLLSKRFDLEAE